MGLNPAAHIISVFKGHDTVAEITGVDRTRVFRWTYPKERGGTGGIIPQAHHPVLLKAARVRELPISAEDFLPPIDAQLAEVTE